MKMIVNTLIPYIGFDIGTLDETIRAMTQSAEKLLEGSPQRLQFETSIQIMQDNRDQLLLNSQKVAAHVQFIEEDGVHGSAEFLVDRGTLEEGGVYAVTFTKEVA